MSDRERFEATYKSVFPGHHLDRDVNGDYVNVEACAAWRVYQVASRAQGDAEPVAWTPSSEGPTGVGVSLCRSLKAPMRWIGAQR